MQGSHDRCIIALRLSLSRHNRLAALGIDTMGATMTNRIILSGLLIVCGPTAAFAHAGHIGELAGHAHWVGVAALAGAAAVAAAATWIGRKPKEVRETRADEPAASDETPQEATP